MISVVILTLNEENNLPSCLNSLPSGTDIVVLDSGSNDQTQVIAEAHGARFISHPFENFGAQRNYAHTNIYFQHQWVFHLDADEQMTPELWQECLKATQEKNQKVDGYWIAPKMIFEDRWIPRCTDFPAYQARLVHVPNFKFIQVGHGQREAPGMRMAHLRESYLHDLSAEPVNEWLAKHRRYARQEAKLHYQDEFSHRRWRDLFSSDALQRRRSLKMMSYRLPFRPELRFIYQYILRGGFIHGGPGFRYCLLLRRYEQYVDEARR